MTFNGKIKIGISACLLGLNVRYDGGNKLDMPLIESLEQHAEWVPVCPEADCGLPVPREEMQLIDSAQGPRLVTLRSGIDHTAQLAGWAEKRLRDLVEENLRGFIWKSRSPSCDYGSGIFALKFAAAFPRIPVSDEESLREADNLKKFLQRVRVYCES